MSHQSSHSFRSFEVRVILPATSYSPFAGGSRSGAQGESAAIQRLLWRRSHGLHCPPQTSVRVSSLLRSLMQSSIRQRHVFFIGFTVMRIPSLIFVRFGRFSFRRLRHILLSFGSRIARAGASCFHRPTDFPQLSRPGYLTKLFGSILMSISLRMESNQSAAANGRPAGQANGSNNLLATVAADRAFPAAVAELDR